MSQGSLYIFIILLCRVVQHLLSKRTSWKVNSVPVFFKYNAYRNLLSAFLGFILIIFAGNSFKCDAFTFGISVFSGLMLTCSSALSLTALKNGTVSLNSLFSTAGLLVPCIGGIFLFDEKMSVFQWLGLLLFFIAACFLIFESKKIYATFSFKNILLLLGITLSEGFTMFSQQIFARCVPDGDVSVFSFISFGTLGLISLLAFPVTTKNAPSERNFRLPIELLTFGAALSVAVFIINQLATLASSTVPPVILFTFINGGSTIIGAIVAAICFKEKLTVCSVLGIILGVTALIIIKAF